MTFRAYSEGPVSLHRAERFSTEGTGGSRLAPLSRRLSTERNHSHCRCNYSAFLTSLVKAKHRRVTLETPSTWLSRHWVHRSGGRGRRRTVLGPATQSAVGRFAKISVWVRVPVGAGSGRSSL